MLATKKVSSAGPSRTAAAQWLVQQGQTSKFNLHPGPWPGLALSCRGEKGTRVMGTIWLATLVQMLVLRVLMKRTTSHGLPRFRALA